MRLRLTVTGARRTGLRGRLIAADRLNLIRVMPAQERRDLGTIESGQSTRRESYDVS